VLCGKQISDCIEWEKQRWRGHQHRRQLNNFRRNAVQMAYKTRVKCFAKLRLEFYANAKRAISTNGWNFCQPGAETPKKSRREATGKKPPV